MFAFILYFFCSLFYFLFLLSPRRFTADKETMNYFKRGRKNKIIKLWIENKSSSWSFRVFGKGFIRPTNGFGMYTNRNASL